MTRSGISCSASASSINSLLKLYSDRASARATADFAGKILILDVRRDDLVPVFTLGT